MEVEVYTFPTLNDGLMAVENKFVELTIKYRNGESLDPEELDWMDAANTWLMSTGD